MTDRQLYTATYETGNTDEVIGVEVPISLPDQPPLEEMINYGLPEKDQKWRRVVIPDEFKTRQAARRVPWQKVKAFTDDMWHRRINGEWWLIKGNPTYITGGAFMYFNFWQYATNTYCDFHMHCVWWWQVALDSDRNPNCFGVVEVKPRRAFSTEMALCWGWEAVTRYRDSNFGIMSKGDDDAEQAFSRLTFANENMIWFFKPKNSGMARPSSMLEYQYPSRRMTRKSTDIDADEVPGLNSRIWYEPTVQGKFDGTKLRRTLLDEKGKILVSKMNIFKQWKILRECLSLKAGTKIIGKAWLPSTIEELDNGKSIEVVQKMWDSSNSQKLGATGRTISGCRRMFRPFWVSGDIDEWGYPKVEEARRVRDAEIGAMEAAGLHEDVTDYKRKYPETVDEALAMPANETILPIPLIDKALERCRVIEEKDMAHPMRAVRGTLAWVDQFGGKVRWMPDPNGRVAISRHPGEANKQIILGDGRVAPGNVRLFAMGVDPIDMRKPAGEGSDGAATVGAMQDYVRDAECTFDEFDILRLGEMWSDACCCDYVYRPELPEEFYEDMLMIAIYYGCQMLVEKQKPGLINWGYACGFGAYFAQKPANADSHWMAKRNTSMQTTNTAIAATTETIQNYYGHMRSHLIRRHLNYTHVRLLTDMRKLTDKNRTDRDLAVSWGWCLTLMSGIAVRTKKARHSKRSEDKPRSLPLSLHGFTG